ncbi:flavodoxin family protein [Lentzea aerocolonigenes]|uniref:flavodoxin family protein n=1 Tax=Lentzea aerocolonigenes TaxID=68170 RepID=UPI000AFA650D|nr:flavodoxin family protein [Lentzea aerocolonigenes]MCP2248125.1 NADPH-dependent FMN reductase [Lentzea aerocolonigenes]
MNELTDPVRLVVACHGGRGHTGRLAAAVRQGALDVTGTDVAVVEVDKITSEQWFQLDDADAVIFGAPTYMGSASAAFHQFAEASSRRWLTRRWQDKLAAGFTNSGAKAGDKSGTLAYFTTFAAQHGMVWINLGLRSGWCSANGSEYDLNRLGFSHGAAAQSNVDEEPELMHKADLETAEYLGRRVATYARVVAAGKRALAR